MQIRSSIASFVSRPRSSAVLAVLLVLLGIVFVSGVIPDSPNRRYLPGHEWLLASLCWVLALLFGYCARQGLTWTSGRSRR
jgi:hypothetical protein